LVEKKKSILNTIIIYLIIFFLVFLVINHFLFKVTEYVENTIPSIPPNSKIIVNLLTYHAHKVERWDIAYLENKDNANQFLARRVLGLPGETIFLKNGDVYIDKVLQQKNSELQKGLWVPGFNLKNQIKKNPNNPEELFLTFQKEFWQITPQGVLKAIPGGQGHIALQMENVSEKSNRDICIKFDITFTKDMGNFFLSTHYYDQQFLLNIPSASNHKNAHIQEKMKILKSFAGIQFRPSISNHVEYWLYDRKIDIYINGTKVFHQNRGSDTINEKQLNPTSIFLGTINSEFTIENFEVKKDVVFASVGRYGVDPELPYKIAPNQYFVATESAETSPSDSRSNGSIGAEYIKGKVTMTLSPNFLQWIY
jgi:hypothetical protein